MSENGITARVGRNLRNLREKQGLKQEELAEKVGLTQGYIGAIERGEKNLSALKSLERLADALGTDLHSLVCRGDSGAGKEGEDPHEPAGATEKKQGEGRPETEYNQGGEEEVGRRQDASEAREILRSHLNKRGVRDNYLSGKGFILSPPFECSVMEDDSALRVEIEGDEESPSGHKQWETSCHRVVAASSRRNALYFITLQEGERPPLREVALPVQDSYWRYLTSLDPGEMVSQDEFKRRNPQSESPRRWRELRNEWGFDARVRDGTNEYERGESIAPINQPEPRVDMGKLRDKFWEEIYDDFGGRCNVCRRKIDRDRSEVLIDHRIPIPFGGSDKKENLQLLCRRCNNKKKTVFQRSPDEFLQEYEYWAYPEKYAKVLRIELPSEQNELLENMAEQNGIGRNEAARRLLVDALE